MSPEEIAALSAAIVTSYEAREVEGTQLISWALQTVLVALFAGIWRNLASINLLCQWLKSEHEDPDSPFATVKLIPLTKKLVDRDRLQHLHNRWVTNVLKMLLRRGSDTPDADELALGPDPMVPED